MRGTIRQRRTRCNFSTPARRVWECQQILFHGPTVALGFTRVRMMVSTMSHGARMMTSPTKTLVNISRAALTSPPPPAVTYFQPAHAKSIAERNTAMNMPVLRTFCASVAMWHRLQSSPLQGTIFAGSPPAAEARRGAAKRMAETSAGTKDMRLPTMKIVYHENDVRRAGFE